MRTYPSLFERYKLKTPVLLLVMCAFTSDSTFTQKDFERLKPIIGTWLNKRSRGDIYETWVRKSEREFTGMSYTMTGRDTTPLETVRLYFHNRQIIYAPVTAGQNDQQPVLFKLKSIRENQFVFENLQHDFPKRIVYDFRSKDSLYAHIEGQVESKQHRIDYPYRRIH